MGENTGISWCHHSFNPWIGCAKISEGCKMCYAEKLATGKMGLQVWGPDAPRRITSQENWRKPLRWNREAQAAGERRRVFCASMADVFEDRPDLIEPRQRLWQLVPDTSNLDWLLLTKRPENVFQLTPEAWWANNPHNVWLGFSAENQSRLEDRLARAQAWRELGWNGIILISYEPALAPISLSDAYRAVGWDGPGRLIDWVIVGGESGPGRRPFDEDWARRVRDECRSAGIAFFYKQKGGPRPEGKMPPVLDGRVYHEFPKPRTKTPEVVL